MRPAVARDVARGTRAPWVAPMMAGAVVILFAALYSGLVHLRLPLPAGGAGLHQGHGPMMVLGFFGTVISLERATALGTWWTYLAPAAAAVGGICVLVGAPADLTRLLLTGAGVVLVGVFVALHRIQPSLHNAVLASGAVCWVVAGALWTAGWEVPRFVPWLTGFLVLTIAGERLELSRLVKATMTSRWLFGATCGVFAAGLITSLVMPSAGVRVAGVGLLGLAAWLLRFDVARRTVRTGGVTRFMAVALLTGYAWLVVGGGLWLAVGYRTQGLAYDAMLHGIFLGFVISMVFAHAPVIIPAVLGRPFPYRPVLYIPLALLHGSLVLRLVGGGIAGNTVAWQWGGVLNEVALLLYLALAATALIRAGTRHAASHPTRAGEKSPDPSRRVT